MKVLHSPSTSPSGRGKLIHGEDLRSPPLAGMPLGKSACLPVERPLPGWTSSHHQGHRTPTTIIKGLSPVYMDTFISGAPASGMHSVNICETRACLEFYLSC